MKKKILFCFVMMILVVSIALTIVSCVNSEQTESQPESVNSQEKCIYIYESIQDRDTTAPYEYKTSSNTFSDPKVPFTKDGYELVSFIDDNGRVYKSSSTIKDGLCLYAQWDAIYYTLVLNSLGEDGKKVSINTTVKQGDMMPYNTHYGQPKGYDFDGWFSSVDSTLTVGSGKKYATSSSWVEQYRIFNVKNFTPNKNNEINLYAGYKQVKVKVTLKYNDEEYADEKLEVLPNSNIISTLNTKIKNDGEKKIMGWIINDSDELFSGNVGTADITLTAVWKKYRELDLEPNGGTVASILIFEGDDKPLPTPTKNSYVFDGWYTNPEFSGKPVTACTYETSNCKFYAKWKGIQYVITYDGNGATSGSMSQQKINYGTSTNISPNKYSRNNYTFVGWNTNKDAKTALYKDEQKYDFKNASSDNTIKLYAIWLRTSLSWSNYDEKKIKRDGIYGLALQGYDTLDLSALKDCMNSSYKFTLNVVVGAREQDDAYQELGLYNSLPEKSTSTNFSYSQAQDKGMVYWQTFEHGSGKKDTNTYDHSFKWIIDGDKMREKMYIMYDSYGGSAFYYAVWYRTSIRITITVEKV